MQQPEVGWDGNQFETEVGLRFLVVELYIQSYSSILIFRGCLVSLDQCAHLLPPPAASANVKPAFRKVGGALVGKVYYN